MSDSSGVLDRLAREQRQREKVLATRRDLDRLAALAVPIERLRRAVRNLEEKINQTEDVALKRGYNRVSDLEVSDAMYSLGRQADAVMGRARELAAICTERQMTHGPEQ